MKKFRIPILIFLVIFSGTFLIYFISSRFFGQDALIIETENREGKTAVFVSEYEAPNFELPNLEGKKTTLSDLKDNIVILNFWTSWNSAAKDQLAILDSYYQKNKNSADVVLLTINNQEDKSVVLNFMRRGGYILPVLLDENGKIGELYNIRSLPLTFFLKQGQVKSFFVGILNETEIKDIADKLR